MFEKVRFGSVVVLVFCAVYAVPTFAQMSCADVVETLTMIDGGR